MKHIEPAQQPKMHVDTEGEEEELDSGDSEDDDYVGEDERFKEEVDAYDLELEHEYLEDEEVDELEEKEFKDYLDDGFRYVVHKWYTCGGNGYFVR